MPRPFDYFVIFAEMRTGSNYLESNLDLFPGLKTYGEAFNPWFMVRPKMQELFGVTVEMRNADPVLLIERMKEHSAGMPGFRFFSDHDPRVFDHIMDDPRCAKVVLTRNHVDAYVSRKIAWETDQWQLNDVHDVVKKQARFVPEEFEKLFNRFKEFQLKLMGRLQRSGQTAFYIDYEDIQDIAVINGLAKFLGETTEITEFADTFKKQNPEALEDKVVNYSKLVETVQKFDFFDLGRIPNFEPRRPPMVPTFVTGAHAPLIYLPIQATPVDQVQSWLAAIDGVAPEALEDGFNQRNLRKWKREHPGHRSFTVLRHPAARAHSAFCRHFLNKGPGAYRELRGVLRDQYDVPFPEGPEPGADWDKEAHRSAFLAFLRFIKRNLDGQTAVRVDGSWASLGATLEGFSSVLTPDYVLRESTLADGLACLAADVGVAAPAIAPAPEDRPFTLADIYDEEVEKAVRKAYQRDYMLFGFGDWSA